MFKELIVGGAVLAGGAAGGLWYARHEVAGRLGVQLPSGTDVVASHGGEGALPSPAEGADAFAVGLGTVDVDGGVTPLCLPLPAPVEEVLVREGQQVRAGQPLVRLRSGRAAAQVAKAEAAVAEARARLAKARRAPQLLALQIRQQQQAVAGARKQRSSLEREVAQLEQLVREETASSDKLLAVRDQLDVTRAAEQAEELKGQQLQLEDPSEAATLAEAALQSADADLAVARQNLQDHTLTAPRDGEVLRILVSVGQMAGASPAQPAAWFRPAEALILRCEIDQVFAARVAAGAAVEVYDDNRQRKLGPGTVTRTAPWIAQRRSQLDEPFQRNDVRTLECIVAPRIDASQLRIGQRVRVVVPLRSPAGAPATS